MTNQDYMKRALELAKKSDGIYFPESDGRLRGCEGWQDCHRRIS